MFSTKDNLPNALKSNVVYKFSCASCNASYIGETTRHLTTRIKEHLSSDKKSHIFKHLEMSGDCKRACSEDCFSILDHAPTEYQLKIKEALHIQWNQPILNKQVWSQKIQLVV